MDEGGLKYLDYRNEVLKECMEKGLSMFPVKDRTHGEFIGFVAHLFQKTALTRSQYEKRHGKPKKLKSDKSIMKSKLKLKLKGASTISRTQELENVKAKRGKPLSN